MSRKIKLVGLAAVAVMAFAAANASAASAEVLFHKTNMGNTVLTGKQVGQNIFSLPEGAITCEVATFTGETEVTTPTTLTITPKYEKCEFAKLGKNSAIVNMNGCDLDLTSHGTVHITCAKGKFITITSAPAGVTKCTIMIPGDKTFEPETRNQNLEKVTYKNEADGTVTVKANIEKITYSTKKGTGAGACEETVETTGGTYVGEINVTGEIGGVMERIWVE